MIQGDCRDVLGTHKADLIYLDPPYLTGRDFFTREGVFAYTDKYSSMREYLEFIGPVLRGCSHALRKGAHLWIHLDHRVVHQIKCLADSFLSLRSMGEVVWETCNANKSERHFGNTHNTLLIYSKGPSKPFNFTEPSCREPYSDQSLAAHFKLADERGRYRERVVGGKTYRYHACDGRKIGSIWSDIPSMGANSPWSSESTGYPTQKPLKLLRRIVALSTTEGNDVLDPMCGSGAMLRAAESLGRHAIGYDIGEEAAKLA